MKNPLIKRLPRELKSEIGKYIVLFLFITIMIGFVSGFLVASNSLHKAYEESFEKYNVEDGNFELALKADETLIDSLEKDKVTIYENFYIEEETKKVDSKLRIFKNRNDINRACIMKGELPKTNSEIAIDRMYADNNELAVGDKLTCGETEYTISGLVALSDYSSLFYSTADTMFDSVKFGVAVVTEEGFEKLGDNHLHYSYSWKYEDAPKDDSEEKEMSDDFLETIASHAIVTNFVPQYLNQAIVFTGTDIGRDNVMMGAFLYIVIIIIAFIFAITTSNTISKEAMVIGTLRASGYTKGELIRHYLTMPVLITLISAIIGNILGYTVFKDVAVDMYYNSYSLTTYVTLWNADAFARTTIIPVILMIAINFFILLNKLSLSPLKFIRRDLAKKQKKKAFRLNTKIGIMKRFRLRIIFQNMPNYITIVIGIFLANIILLFGIGFPHLFNKYEKEIVSNAICEYQYILKAPAETDTTGVEKYCATGLKTIEGRLKSEEVSIFGIQPDSKYIDIDCSGNGVYISNAFSEKFGIDKGETLTLKEEYGDKKYEFKVDGIYYYPAGIAVFMDTQFFNDTFDYDADYFNGYFSNKEIDDIDETYIATKITLDDLTKTSRQMIISMGEIMDLFLLFGVVMFMLIIYLLSKIIIEKNAQSISMTKILGYTNREISSLYIITTSIVVIASLILTIPIVSILLKYVFVIIFAEYAGWIPFYVPFYVYIQMAVTGIIAYALIAFLQFRRVKKIPLDVALKNVE